MTSANFGVSSGGGSGNDNPTSGYMGVPRPTVQRSNNAQSTYMNVGDTGGANSTPSSPYQASTGGPTFAYVAPGGRGGSNGTTSAYLRVTSPFAEGIGGSGSGRTGNFETGASSAYFGVGGGSAPSGRSSGSSTMTAVGGTPLAGGWRCGRSGNVLAAILEDTAKEDEDGAGYGSHAPSTSQAVPSAIRRPPPPPWRSLIVPPAIAEDDEDEDEVYE